MERKTQLELIDEIYLEGDLLYLPLGLDIEDADVIKAITKGIIKKGGRQQK